MMGRAALVALAVGALGCPRDSEGQPTPKPSASAVASTSASASAVAPLSDVPPGPSAIPARAADTLVARGALRVELVEGGGAPREPVRTTIRSKSHERVVLTADVDVSVAATDGARTPQPVPLLKVTLDAQVTVAGDKAALVVTLAEVGLDPRGELEVSALDQMKSEAARLEGVTFELPIGERGRAGPPTVPAGAAGPALQLWTTVAEAVRELVVPLPAEPIGKGARWQVFERLPRAGVEMLRRTRYTLEAIEGGELRIVGEVHEVAISGGGDADPALPKEVRVEPVEGTSKGEHTLRRPLVDAVLAGGNSRLESRLVTDLRHEGNAAMRGTVYLKQTLRAVREKGRKP